MLSKMPELQFIDDRGTVTKQLTGTNVPVSLLISSKSLRIANSTSDFDLIDYFEVIDGQLLTNKQPSLVIQGQTASVPIARGFTEGVCNVGSTCTEGNLTICSGVHVTENTLQFSVGAQTVDIITLIPLNLTSL